MYKLENDGEGKHLRPQKFSSFWPSSLETNNWGGFVGSVTL